MTRSIEASFLCVLLLCAFGSSSAAAGESSRSSRAESASSGKPTIVSVGFLLVDVLDIDAVHQSMRADFSVHLSWQDESLAGRWENKHVLDVGDVWTPDLQIVNDLSLTRRRREVVEVEPDGTVTYRQRYFGELSLRMDIREFPMDRHRISIEFVSASPGEVEFVRREDRILQKDELTVVDWSIGSAELVLGTVDIGYTMSPGFSFEFEATRRNGYYLWRVIIPLALIAFMSFAVFWVDPTQIDAQLTVAASAMLTVTAFLFSLSSVSPPVPYQTRLDKYVFLSILVIFLALVEAVVSSRLAGRKRELAARRVDRVSRWVFPAVFVVLGTVLLLT